VRRYPYVYHMAELRSWPSIQKHGLLSTSALLDLFEKQGPERVRLESQWRAQSVTISHPSYGQAVIRDQKPMPEPELRRLLIEMTAREWYELINGKTFFWADWQRLSWMLGAYRNTVHCVLTVDTRLLVDSYLERLWLTDQNSGSVYSGKLRGRGTFRRVSDFDFRWVAELAVDYAVPDVADLTVKVEERNADRSLRQIWSRRDA
jgi:uncharacterized protein DUF7002